MRTLSWKVRFGTHGLVSAAFLYGLARQGGFEGLSVLMASGLGIVLFLFLAGYANAFNFMDGINGIAASQAAVTGLGTIAVAHVAGISFAHPALVLTAIIAGAAAGFLPHNFPKARMFMGDVGAVFLGFGLAAIAVWIAADHGWWLLVPLGCLHANFILDTAITVVRRILRGEVFHQAHREHFYQRLVRAGWSHARVTLTEAVLQIVVATVLTLAVSRGGPAVWAASLAVVVVWVKFFLFCEKTFRTYQIRAARESRE
jgi:UDP-N-acetylmuramyl pentapeptide phosphotransferase/UDP-N-acetylglucosamine-1-phosphate transferase